MPAAPAAADEPPLPPPPPAGAPAAWRRRIWKWWLASVFQRTWMRLAVQAGVSTLLIMCIFSAPAVWSLHELDPILANPVLVLVIANLGLLFTANTGLPALKIGYESVLGSLTGGAATFGIIYLAYAINGGSNEPTVLKAAMVILFGSLALIAGTASRFRWPQHVALAGIIFNLTVSVGVAATYYQTHHLWHFVLYWWWFIGLAVVFTAGVASLVLPLPAGWVVRKQLARSLRQEGAVLEAIIHLLTTDDAHVPQPAAAKGKLHTAGGGGPAATADSAASAEADCGQGPVAAASTAAAAAARSSGGEQEQGVDETAFEKDEVDFPDVSQPGADEALASRLRGLWRRVRGRSGRALSRISSTLSLRAGASSRANLKAAAEAMGINSELYEAVEPIYTMSGPTSVSIQAAWAHLRFAHVELDVYRPTHRLPVLPFQRMVLLARTLLSAAMMMLYSVQTGRARLGASREHAVHLQRTAAEVKRCCQCLAGVLRHNAPAGPAIHQLARLEQAYLELQQAVGAAEKAGDSPEARAARQQAQEVAEELAAAERDAAESAAQVKGGGGAALLEPGVGSFRPQRQPPAADVAGADVAGADGAQDSLALHLSLSMLFTCCTKVRSMYLLLPQLVGRDQEGVGEAVALHFAAAHAWEAVLHARTSLDAVPPGPQGASDVFRRSQLLWGTPQGGLRSSRSSAALDKLTRPEVQVAEPAAAVEPIGRMGRAVGRLHGGFAAAERWTGFTRNQLALGLQMAAAFTAVMFLVVVPAANAALGHRAVWAVFIIVVVHEPLLGSVIWKCVLRFGGTVLAGVLGLGALYFTVLCNGLSFENHPPKFIAMTVALTILTMPLAAGTAYFGLRNSYFWIVSCLIMYTVALPGYAHDSPMPVLALWRLACTALGLLIELLAALLVFPVTARSAAHAVAAGALRGMADVADIAFHSVLPAKGGDHSVHLAKGDDHSVQLVGLHTSGDAGAPEAAEGAAAGAAAAQEQQAQQAQHVAVHCSAPVGWHGNEVAAGAVLSSIFKPMMEAYGRITTLRALLVPLRVEYHPFKTPTRFPTGPGRRVQRLCRRMLNTLTTFAAAMDSHHTQSVPLLEPHAAELEGLIQQLKEALRAVAAMVGGTVSLEGAARTVAALEVHAQHLLLRVLLSGPPEGLSTTDATQGLACLAMLFNVTSVARLLCIALGEAFCPADADGQAAAAALLRDSATWAGDSKLQALAAELISQALATTEDE